MGVAQAKKTAWGWFSKYIRLRDCLITNQSTSSGYCCTCNMLITFEGNQAGHFLSGRVNDVLIDEVGVNLQCIECNFTHGGEQAKYYFFLKRRYGKDIADYYRDYIKQVKPMKEYEWREISDEYRIRYNELLKRTTSESLKYLGIGLKVDLEDKARLLL